LRSRPGKGVFESQWFGLAQRGSAIPKDYYLVLGVSKRANLNKIEQAYRTVAKKYHPDMSHSPESTEKFTEIKEAYETLGDEL
jgi:DnaJ-class molecular chaperone